MSDFKLCLICKKKIVSSQFASHFIECRKALTKNNTKKTTNKIKINPTGDCGCNKKKK